MTNTKSELISILTILNDYIIFIYPGWISLFFYAYLDGKRHEENLLLIIKSIIISHFYLKGLQYIFHHNLVSFQVMASLNHVILFVLAITLPLLFYKFVHSKLFNCIQKTFGISTRISSNPIEIALSKSNNDSPCVCVYMDELGIMYEGFIRNYIKDTKQMTYLMLSNYKIFKLKTGTNKYKQTFPSKKHKKQEQEVNQKNWVILYFNQITRIELAYNEEY